MTGGDLAVPRPRIWHRLALAAGVVLLLLAGFVTIKLLPLLSDGKQYAAVVSVERHPDFRDAALLRTAWALPVASRYRQTPYEFQDNPSYCGPTSVANLLRSAGRRTDQHRVIDGTRFEPWFGILLGGLTLDEEAELLRLRVAAPVTIVRGASLAEFRREIARANDPATRIIVNFHRGPLFARGHGHFSPVLGYLPDRDLAFVGDVNADYRPYLVPVARLWEAAGTTDSATGKPRGLLITRLSLPPS